MAMLVYGLLYIPAFQTFAAQRLAAFLQYKYGLSVSIGKVKIEFVKTVKIEDVFVKDLQNDTLLFAHNIELDIESYNLERSKFRLKYLGLEDVRFRMFTEKNDSVSNLEKVLDIFLSGDTTVSTPGPPVNILVGKINLENIHFTMQYADDSTHEFGMDYEDMDISELNAQLENVLIIDDSITARIQKLSCAEKCGIKLKHLSGNAVVSSTITALDDMSIVTSRSKTSGKYKMVYKTWSDYLDYIYKVKMIGAIDKAVIHTDDIAYFAPQLKNWHQRVELDGKIKGTVDNFTAKGVNLSFMNATRFKGNVSINGLPEIEASFISIDAKEIVTTASDAQRFCDFAIDTGIVVPKEIESLGQIAFTGSFTGFINQFTSYGLFTSKAGILKTDISLEQRDKTYYYKGKLATESFDLSYLTNDKDLGILNSELTIDGKGFSLKSIEADLEGDFYSFNYKGYEYRDIFLSGNFEKAKFIGQLLSDDPNAAFDFNGEMDFNTSLPLLNFDIDIYSLNLSELHLMEDSLHSEVSGQVSINAQGLKISDVTGTVVINNVVFCQSDREYVIPSAEIIARNNPREIQVFSPLLDLRIKGNFIPEELPQSFMSVVSDAMPALALEKQKTKKKLIRQDFSFSATIKDAGMLNEFVGDSIFIASGTSLIGFYDNTVNTFELSVEAPHIQYAGYSAYDIRLFAKKVNDVLNTDIRIDNLKLSDSAYFKNFDILAKVVENNLQFSLAWINSDDDRGKFDGVGQVIGNGKFNLDLLPGFIMIKGQKWESVNPANIYYDSSRFAIKDFLLKNQERELTIHGKISQFNSDKLYFEVKGFDLLTFGHFIPMPLSVGGEINGKGYLSNPYHNLNFQADIRVTNFAVNSQNMGDLVFTGSWSRADSSITISSTLDNAGHQSLNLKGAYYPSAEGRLDMDLAFKDYNLEALNALNLEFLTDFAGSLNGKVSIKGNLNAPQLKGILTVRDAQMRVDYLNTTYRFNDKILVNPEWIGFNRMQVTDEFGNRASATGTAFHKNFGNWSYDFAIQMEDFLTLNTNETQNDLFYGTAYATGDVNISGYSDNLDIEVRAKTTKGTKMAIPLGGAEEVYAQEFVRFINTGKDAPLEEEINLTGIKLNLDVEATEDAEMRIIFDEKIGDVISGSGVGRLNMEVTPSGDFRMYGRYEISRGNYLFTLKNLINKGFTVSKGSTITWYGDPYDAYVDINAEYPLRTSLYDIMPTNDERYKRRELVKCIMHMSGKLLEPDIKFDIAVPNADDFVKGQLAAVKNDENELNKQFLSLLVTQSFAPLQNGVKDVESTGGSAVGSNSMELLSGQLNNWFQGVSKDFSVGFNLRNGDNRLTIGKQLFNNRITVNSNVGYANRANTTTQQGTNTFVGDVSIEYSITPDGRFKIRAFRETSDNLYLGSNLSSYSQGASLFYQEQFDTFKELRQNFATLFERKRKKKVEADKKDAE